MKYQSLILICFTFILTACGTTKHDREWHAEQDKYKRACVDWYKKVGKKKFQRKPGEEAWALQNVMATRCQEDPSLCTPPSKPQKLYHYERYWGTDVTGDACSDFPNDFRDDRFD